MTAPDFSTDEARGYLAAMIDGEGYVPDVKVTRAKHPFKNIRYVSIVNTQPELIDAVRAACQVLGIGTVVHLKKNESDPIRKPLYSVRIKGLGNLARLQSLVRLRSPYKQASLDSMLATFTRTGQAGWTLGNYKITSGVVQRMRAQHAEGVTVAALARAMGIPYSTAYSIVKGRRRKEI